MLLLSTLQSCVSKKRFATETKQKAVAERKAEAFYEENKILRGDYETLKRETEAELASKQLVIDSLLITINSLTSNINSEKDNSKDQFFSFQLETSRLNQQLSEKDKEIRNLTREINTLKVQIEDLTRELENAKSGFKFPFGNVKQLERKIEAKEKIITSLDSSLIIAKEEIDLLNVKIDSQRLVIEKLEQERDSVNKILSPAAE